MLEACHREQYGNILIFDVFESTRQSPNRADSPDCYESRPLMVFMFVPLLCHKPQNLVVQPKATREFSGERNVIRKLSPEIRRFLFFASFETTASRSPQDEDGAKPRTSS